VLIVVALIGGGGYLGWEMFKNENAATESQAGFGALAEELQKARAEPNAGRAAAPAASATAVIAAEEFDFLKLAREGNRDPAALKRAGENLASLEAWRRETLRRYSADRPLDTTRAQIAAAQPLVLFHDSKGQLMRSNVGNPIARTQSWETLAPVDQGAAILSLLLDVDALPAREVVRGAEAFAYLHNLPELAAALQAKRPR
jgi:hypothetical protein